jgi:hypothetical protein
VTALGAGGDPRCLVHCQLLCLNGLVFGRARIEIGDGLAGHVAHDISSGEFLFSPRCRKASRHLAHSMPAECIALMIPHTIIPMPIKRTAVVT